tara:strand:- start:268332 stop:268607 length:276 start_codon:yes stop_codon:yes gene_type:complete
MIKVTTPYDTCAIFAQRSTPSRVDFSPARIVCASRLDKRHSPATDIRSSNICISFIRTAHRALQFSALHNASASVSLKRRVFYRAISFQTV